MEYKGINHFVKGEVHSSRTIIVSGALANKPYNGGNAWTRLNWLLGLKRLGIAAYFIEVIDPKDCVDAAGNRASFENSLNLAYFRDVIRQFKLEGVAFLVSTDGKCNSGVDWSQLESLCRNAEMHFNISGHLADGLFKQLPKCRVYFDDDPGYTQFWQAMNSSGSRLAGHDYFFTLGQNIGTPECPIPTCEMVWNKTRTPVLLTEWKGQNARTLQCFSTIASWRGAYGPVQYAGTTYGLKAHEFRKFLDLPNRVKHRFEIALDIHESEVKDLNALCLGGWNLLKPREVAADPDAYRSYIAESGAEFSVAQGIYVQTNSAWFSDRTAHYLALGKPALVQDTGFSRYLPTGDGLVTFRTLDEATDGARKIIAQYEHHCRAARRIAEEYFDSGKIIRQMLKQIGFS